MKLLIRIMIWGGMAALVLVGLIEAALWIFAPVGKRASTRFAFDNQLPGLKERVAFKVDERSSRSWPTPNAAAATEGREVNILVLGGGASVALLQNDDDAWWGQLGAALQKEFPQARISVSALVREYSTILHAAKWAERHLPDVNPDIVIVMHGFEDVLSHGGDYTYNPNKLATLSVESSNRGPLKEFLVNTSQLCRRFVLRGQKRAVTSVIGPLGERNAFAQRLAQNRQIYAQLPLAYEVDRPEGRDPMREYLDGLSTLAQLSAKQGAALAVIGEPTLHRGLMDGGSERLLHRWFKREPAKGDAGVVRLDSGWIELQLSRYYTAAEKFCSQSNIAFTDPTRKLPAHPAVFIDDTMLTDAGAITLATLVQPVVRPLVQARLTQ
ncbi:MAG: hypothetical protein ACKV19_09815 [Verrucomicrobiales bacterium]